MYGEENNGMSDNMSYSGEETVHARIDEATFRTERTEAAQASENGSGRKKRDRRKREKKENRGILKSALNGAVFGCCAAAIFCGIVAVGSRTFLKPEEVRQSMQTVDMPAETEIPYTDTADGGQKTELLAQTQEDRGEVLSISQIVDRCQPSVVSITTKGIEEVRSMFGTQKYQSQGAGSGIIIGQNEEELLIATNNHVVSGAEEVSVCFNDASEDAVVSAKVKGTDASNDLAIVTVQLAEMSEELLGGIRVASIGNSDELAVGDQVVAIGNALGYGQSVTTGIVSALNREVTIEDYSSDDLIQTDAAINPGNSGGALLNMRGELVGINSAKFASEQVEGMGYAIPIATAKPILDSLMNRETRELADEEDAGFLGVSCQDVSKEAAQLYGIPTGAYVAAVEKGSAAEAAGIQKGDIITKFDGLTIGNAAELRNNIAYYKKGETVTVVFMRADNGDYKENTVDVTLAHSAAASKQKDGQNETMQPDEDEAPQDGQADDFFGNDMLNDLLKRFYGVG